MFVEFFFKKIRTRLFTQQPDAVLFPKAGAKVLVHQVQTSGCPTFLKIIFGEGLWQHFVCANRAV